MTRKYTVLALITGSLMATESNASKLGQPPIYDRYEYHAPPTTPLIITSTPETVTKTAPLPTGLDIFPDRETRYTLEEILIAFKPYVNEILWSTFQKGWTVIYQGLDQKTARLAPEKETAHLRCLLDESVMYRKDEDLQKISLFSRFSASETHMDLIRQSENGLALIKEIIKAAPIAKFPPKKDGTFYNLDEFIEPTTKLLPSDLAKDFKDGWTILFERGTHRSKDAAQDANALNKVYNILYAASEEEQKNELYRIFTLSRNLELIKLHAKDLHNKITLHNHKSTLG